MNKKLLQSGLYAGLLFFAVNPVQAQFADSIWTGNAKITLPALSVVADGVVQKAPSTTTNVTFQVPVEVWFWDDGTFLVCLDQKATGANPDRAPLQPLIGEWTIPVACRVGALAGVTQLPYGGNMFEVQTGKINFNSRKKNGTFEAVQRDTTTQEGEEEYIYPKAQQKLSGSFRLLNSSKISLSGTIITIPNPIGPNGLKYLGRAPSVQMELSKSNRKPSVEGVARLDD
jgi:hypothetical protein